MSAPSVVLTAVNVSVAVYLAATTVVGSVPRRRTAQAPRGTTFMILVPAHDEEAVIARTLRSFDALDYDRALFDVHVVADNCSDRTSTIVREHGWNAHDRDAPADPGKGPALNWLFEILDRTCEFDVAVVVDADTVVDRAFLRELDAAFAEDVLAVQAYYSVLDPTDSPSASLRFAALACRHHLRPLARNRWGASAGLYGNGMAFRRSVLRRHRFSGHLVEDAEFQMELLLRDGILVRYAPAARVEAEMPDTLEAATSQNERWERGRIEMARRYVPALTNALLSGGPRRARVDAIIDHLIPPVSVVALLDVVGLAGSAAAAATVRGRSRAKNTRRAILNLGTMVILGVHVVAGLRAVSAPRSIYAGLMSAPRAVLWKAGLWFGALRSKNEVIWRRTKRNSETPAGSWEST